MTPSRSPPPSGGRYGAAGYGVTGGRGGGGGGGYGGGGGGQGGGGAQNFDFGSASLPPSSLAHSSPLLHRAPIAHPKFEVLRGAAALPTSAAAVAATPAPRSPVTP